MREGECTEVDYVNPCGEVLELNEDHERTIWYLNIASHLGMETCLMLGGHTESPIMVSASCTKPWPAGQQEYLEISWKCQVQYQRSI